MGEYRISAEGWAERAGFFPALATYLSFLGVPERGKVQSRAGSLDTHSRLATLIPVGRDGALLGLEARFCSWSQKASTFLGHWRLTHRTLLFPQSRTSGRAA